MQLVRPREIRYGSEEFLAASNWARNLTLPFRPPALIRTVVRDPALVRALFAIWRLPVVNLRIREEDIDAWPEINFGPFRRRQPARAILKLPAAEECYLVGRSRQALRTNLGHARRAGVTSARVPYETWFEAVGAVRHARHLDVALEGNWAEPRPGQQAAYYVARDAAGTPLAFAGVALFGQSAVLFAMFSHSGRYPCASWARYQLHTCLALDLGSSGVEYLLVGSALRETAGNQYFQHLLGYHVRNLRITTETAGSQGLESRNSGTNSRRSAFLS